MKPLRYNSQTSNCITLQMIERRQRMKNKSDLEMLFCMFSRVEQKDELHG